MIVEEQIMVETDCAAAKKPDRRPSNFERKAGARGQFVRKDGTPPSCLCVDRWENEGGTVTMND